MDPAISTATEATTQTAIQSPAIQSSESQWWRQAAVYQIYPRSFADANGDGLGDLPGVTSRVGYLTELGIDAVWLSPFYPSALADGGYDVDDYRNVDPRLGTLEDFDAMVTAAAHLRHQGHRRCGAEPQLQPARMVHRSPCRRAGLPRTRPLPLLRRARRER